MEGVFNDIAQKLIELHKEFINFLPSYLVDFFNLLALVLLIVLYSIFIWKFYRFIALNSFQPGNSCCRSTAAENFLRIAF